MYLQLLLRNPPRPTELGEITQRLRLLPVLLSSRTPHEGLGLGLGLGTSGLGLGLDLERKVLALALGRPRPRLFPHNPGHVVAVRVCSAQTSGVTSHRQPRQCRGAQGPITVKGAQSDRNY